jgi:hypothetical protein
VRPRALSDSGVRVFDLLELWCTCTGDDLVLSLCSTAYEERVHPGRLLRRAQPAAARRMC